VKDPAALRGLGPLDLVVYDGEVPPDPPRTAAAIYVGCVPPAPAAGEGPAVTVEGTISYPPVIDWSRTHAVTRHAEFSELIVVEALRLKGVPRAGVLVDSVEGPLLAMVPTRDGEALVIPFDLAKSNLPLKVAFPLLLANALEYLFSARRTGDPEEVLRTGEPIVRAATAGASVEFRDPAGESARATAGAEGRVRFGGTWRTGLYRILGPAADEEDHAAAALLSRSESDIAPRARIAAGGVEHPAAPESVRTNILLRDPLLLLAAAILMLEWILWATRR